MAKRIDTFGDLGGSYGGCTIDLYDDGTFQTRTCCDYDSWDRQTMVRLRDWLIKALERSDG